jgi:hypothetical protein
VGSSLILALDGACGVPIFSIIPEMGASIRKNQKTEDRRNRKWGRVVKLQDARCRTADGRLWTIDSGLLTLD